MNLSWSIVLGLAVGIAACDKKEGVPMPKTGAAEVKHQATRSPITQFSKDIPMKRTQIFASSAVAAAMLPGERTTRRYK